MYIHIHTQYYDSLQSQPPILDCECQSKLEDLLFLIIQISFTSTLVELNIYIAFSLLVMVLNEV